MAGSQAIEVAVGLGRYINSTSKYPPYKMDWLAGLAGFWLKCARIFKIHFHKSQENKHGNAIYGYTDAITSNTYSWQTLSTQKQPSYQLING